VLFALRDPHLEDPSILEGNLSDSRDAPEPVWQWVSYPEVTTSVVQNPQLYVISAHTLLLCRIQIDSPTYHQAKHCLETLV
jgi:hypothetical protein